MTIEYDQTRTLRTPPDQEDSAGEPAALKVGEQEMALDQTAPLDDTEVRNFSREDADNLIGRQLAHFKVLGTVGGGGMGTVYRARDVALDRVVALKVLPQDFNEPELIERFKREARAQARLSHPNVVPIYFIGEQDGRHFFAMELVEGRSLDGVLESEGAIQWSTAIDYMIDVATALQHAHERGLIHRDLKPGNLLLTPQGRIKVADFGLAKPLEEGDAALTREGEFMGTPMYVAPEQARGIAVDHRADMYALGATFYHLLTDQPVFSASSVVALLVKHVSEPAPTLEHGGVKVPAALANIFNKLLAKAPEDRFADYDALIAALDAARPRRLTNAGFLVRSAAGFVDFLVFCVLGVATGNFVLLLFPLYLTVALGWRGQTVGQWLFRLQTLSVDNSKLTWETVGKRVSLLYWGLVAVVVITFVLQLVTGIEVITFKNGELHGAGDTAIQAMIVTGLMLVIFAWGIGFAVAAFHPRKRSAYDLLSRTKVVYRIGAEQ